MNAYTLVERDALHGLLIEVHDLRARQGVDWRWMDSLPPRLYAETVAAFEEEKRVSDPAVVFPTPENERAGGASTPPALPNPDRTRAEH